MRWLTVLLVASVTWAREFDPKTIHLADGYRIELYSGAVPGARSMVRSPSGTIYVGTRNEGVVYALPDRDGNYRPDEVITVAEGLTEPNGVAWRESSLYVAERSRILRFDRIEERLKNPLKPFVLRDDLPTERDHGWRYMRFGPDGWLYVAIGAPCNVCESEAPIYASITRYSVDGKIREVYARGIRNSVGFDWDPRTLQLWFTDNGRDNMGDDLPPDELNHAPQRGMNFGYPYCHGNGLKDIDLPSTRSCDDFAPPAALLGPHVAALGMRFYKGDVLIAEHGSWNRRKPIGYRLTRIPFKNGKPSGYEVFADGWRTDNGKVWGRPVDLLVLPDNSILVSDDKAGAIYRIVPL